MMKVLTYPSFAAILWLAGLCMPAQAALPVSIPEDGHSGVILTYGRIGEDAYPDNDITTEQFQSHVDEIAGGGYNVMKLPDLVTALKNKDALSPRTIAITFDGAYKSALKNAIPALLDKKIPFTVFYASDNADANSAQYMNWDDLKNLATHDGVTLGIMPASYARLSAAAEDEMRRQINKAKQRARDMLGAEPMLFSYPYGEYSSAYKKIIENSGFTAAFGLQSGVAAPSSDFYALPRFTMTEKYGDVDRFQTVAEALPFPASDFVPADTFLKSDTPAIGFSAPAALTGGLKNLACFISGAPQPKVEIIGSRVELRPAGRLDNDRIRVNCTMPGPSADEDSPQYRWFGMLLTNPAASVDSANSADLSPQTGEPQ